jgi:hypothetical protein
MMKWITTILSFFFGAQAAKPLNFNLKQIALDVADEMALKTRKPAILILAGVFSIIFFSGGAFMAIFNATRQYDTTGHIYATATLWTGIGIAAFFAIGYTWVFAREWPGAKRHHAQMAKEKIDRKMHEHDDHRAPGIDQALSLFILDLVDERRAKRTRRSAAAASAHESDSMAKAHPGYQEGPTDDPRGFA